MCESDKRERDGPGYGERKPLTKPTKELAIPCRRRAMRLDSSKANAAGCNHSFLVMGTGAQRQGDFAYDETKASANPPRLRSFRTTESDIMSKIKLPYTMYCTFCKVGIKIKNEKSIGTTIHCPKCKKRIEIVTPEMDGHIAYGVSEALEARVDEGPSPEQLIELEIAAERQRKWVRSQRIKYAIELIVILGMLSFCGYIFYQKIYVEGYNERPPEKQPKKFEKRVGGS